MPNGTPDTAQVIVLPPLVYGAAFIIGLLLHLMLPLHVLPTTLARWIGVVCVLVSLPLAITTSRVLSHAHTPVDPMKPTTALNQTTRYWHTGSARKHTVPTYSGRDVYESHVD